MARRLKMWRWSSCSLFSLLWYRRRTNKEDLERKAFAGFAHEKAKWTVRSSEHRMFLNVCFVLGLMKIIKEVFKWRKSEVEFILKKKKKKRRAKTFRQSTRSSVWLCLQETKEKSVRLTFDRVVQHFLGVVEVNSEEDPLTENADDQEQHELEHTGKNWVRGTEIFFWLIFDREVYPWARGSPVKCLSCSFFYRGSPWSGINFPARLSFK